MRSSTSSSEHPTDRAPAKNWFVVWGLAVALCIVLLAGLEFALCSAGYVPSVRDTASYWAWHRRKASDESKQHVVLLGASRMQLGFSPDVFCQRYPDCPLTNLSVSGAMPVAALFDLAEDESFRGIVLCSISVNGFAKVNWGAQQGYVAEHRRATASLFPLDPYIASVFQKELVILGEQMRPRHFVRALIEDSALPPRPHVIMLPDRSRRADYSLLDDPLQHFKDCLVQLEDTLPKEWPTPDEWMEDVRVVESAVKKMQDRGCPVIFVRFPTSGIHLANDERVFPREAFWDRMAEFTSAETIHFADVPGMSGFDLPDTSHLDYRDAPAFTNALLDELERRGVL